MYTSHQRDTLFHNRAADEEKRNYKPNLTHSFPVRPRDERSRALREPLRPVYDRRQLEKGDVSHTTRRLARLTSRQIIAADGRRLRKAYVTKSNLASGINSYIGMSRTSASKFNGFLEPSNLKFDTVRHVDNADRAST